MPPSRECDFCGEDIEPGTGTMYVEVNGTVTHFCSSKCEANAGLGREARDLEWTQAGRRAKDARRPQEAAVEPAAEADEETDEAAGTPDLEAAEAEDEAEADTDEEDDEE